MNDQNRYLHLTAIEIGFVGARRVSKLAIKFKDESSFEYKSDIFKKTDFLYWECDVYVKSPTTGFLTVQKPYSFLCSKLVAEFRLIFDSTEVEDDKTVVQTDPKSGVIVKLSFGKSKPGLNVTRLLAYKAVSALATKVDMLDDLDQVLTYLNLMSELESDAAQLNPAAHIVIPIATAAFKQFREIPDCHFSLVLFMDDLVALLPEMKLALDHAMDAEFRMILQNFLDLVKSLLEGLIEYSSRSPPDFSSWRWLRSKRDEVMKLKSQVLHLKLNVGYGLSANIQGGVSEIQGGMPQIQIGITEVRQDVAGIREAIAGIRQHQLSEADEKALQRLTAVKIDR